jgi:16S rRNA (guanine966-N2)-methyltransferase
MHSPSVPFVAERAQSQKVLPLLVVRITGGRHRSRTLRAPRGAATRPSSDRVREALFSILASQGEIGPVRVLDLYAGTGALGLEALSRGAACATFVEHGREALSALRANVATLGFDANEARVLDVAVERAGDLLAREPPFDLVFADPPYADVANGRAVRALAAVLDRGVLAAGGLFMLEHARASEPPAFVSLALSDSRRYGDTVVSFYRP